MIRRVVKHVDVLVGNEEDLQMGLGIPGRKGWLQPRQISLDPHAFFGYN